ncbi:SDR family oxidoreductase [Lewinella sp. W8]|uniref:SDR family oxidoreductase n=1 Tax=Lewinella sp. W8 TaxID=2528208 RepID=UPI0010679BCA|nr:SDR family oxidoreductase [Lewinella sp. W8]MTB52667.1 NAD(P)H-binding protein [Lewinella sp. W8]
MQERANKERISILGAGWLGLACARRLVAAGHSVSGSSRGAETREELRAIGAVAYSLDLPQSAENASELLGDRDVVILTLPPGGRQYGAAATERYLEKLGILLPLLKQKPSPRVIYTSSTGVYGAATGTVDESSPLAPDTHSSRAVVAAEVLLRENLSELTILRLAGLVGPGRHPGRFYGGRDRPIPQADAPVNLVHQLDVVRAIEMVIAQNLWGMTFNVCATAHPQKGEFYGDAAKSLGLSIAGTLPGGENAKVISSDNLRRRGWQPAFDAAEDLLLPGQM